ncbi:MAG: lipopolysaccharide biosynthesis protein [Endomicrobium sp.]|jgi:O-antigen/teichoic acid export membrane protein|nr:lipopolysaccharide biosynthesis protein [Endomicrobium sp.]
MSNKLKSGILWSVIEIVIKRGIDFIVKLILARILFPEDFGVVGMAAVFISFIQVLNDAGMGPAIIQKKNLNERHLNTVFWTNVCWSILLYLFLSFIVAPIAANFYEQPILTKIIPVLSLSILSSALNTVHFSQLRKELNFRKIAFIRNISSFIAGIAAISMAFFDFGVWALVANDVIAYLITVPLFYNATKWKPSLQWDKNILKEILSFGIFITGSKIIINLVSNADYLIIGKWVGASAVGIYTLAFMMTNLVSGQVTSMLDTVMFPFYSSIQDDIENLRKYYLKLVGYYILFLYPIMLTLFLFAEELVPLFFGNQWGDAIIPLRILSLSVMIVVLTHGYNLLFRSTGRPKYEFKIQRITSLVIYLPCLVLGIYLYGIIGAAAGVLLSRLINFFIHQYILKKYFKIRIGDIFQQAYKMIILCISLSVIVFMLRYLKIDEYFILIIYALLFSTTYFALFKGNFIKIIHR